MQRRRGSCASRSRPSPMPRICGPVRTRVEVRGPCGPATDPCPPSLGGRPLECPLERRPPCIPLSGADAVPFWHLIRISRARPLIKCPRRSIVSPSREAPSLGMSGAGRAADRCAPGLGCSMCVRIPGSVVRAQGGVGRRLLEQVAATGHGVERPGYNQRVAPTAAGRSEQGSIETRPTRSDSK